MLENAESAWERMAPEMGNAAMIDRSDLTDAGKLNGVPQRRAHGGYYAQYEVDEILELEAEWIIEYVKYATRHKERQDGKF